MRRGEINKTGGVLENISASDGLLADIYNSNLNLTGNIIESHTALWIRGTSNIRVSDVLNWGLNSGKNAFFYIDEGATGSLKIRDSFLIRPYAYNNPDSMIRVVSDVAGTPAVNTVFRTSFTNVELVNHNLQASADGYTPIISGGVGRYIGCRLVTTDVAGGVVITLENLDLADTKTSSFPFDKTFNTVSNFPTDCGGGVTDGNIFFFHPGGSGKYGKVLEAPLNDLNITQTLNIQTSVPGHSISATFPKQEIDPTKAHLLTGIVKTGIDNYPCIIFADYYDYENNFLSTEVLFNIAASLSFMPLEVVLRPHTAAYYVQLKMYTESISLFTFAGLSLS
jgi:hypothetical protein